MQQQLLPYPSIPSKIIFDKLRYITNLDLLLIKHEFYSNLFHEFHSVRQVYLIQDIHQP
jgi:hypothetical protein